MTTCAAAILASLLVSLLLAVAPADAQVVIVYSRVDREHLDRILVHLRPAERAGLSVWADVRLVAGEVWQEAIQRAIREARVAVLLVSADFLASEYIAAHELPPILAAAAVGRLRVVPVIVGPSRFARDEIGRFQALNDPKRPLVALTPVERETVYAALAELLEASASSAPLDRKGSQ